jgi:putative lipoprotein (rSAM/lipoprotein system)
MIRFVDAVQRRRYFFLKFFAAAIGAIAAFLFKCSPFADHIIPSYGIPMASYKISGAITAADTKQAIPSIRLYMKDSIDTVSHFTLDSTLSDTAGRYSFEFSSFLGDSTWKIEARDIDGAQNGSYTPKDTIISIPRNALTGASGSENLGHAEKTVNIQLDKSN